MTKSVAGALAYSASTLSVLQPKKKQSQIWRIYQYDTHKRNTSKRTQRPAFDC